MATKTDPAILFVKPKAISTEDKKLLATAGVVVIEIDQPTEVKFIRAGTEMSASQMLRIAAEAIGNSEVSIKVFGKLMADALTTA